MVPHHNVLQSGPWKPRTFIATDRAGEALTAGQELLAQFMRHSPIYAYIKTVTPTESRVLHASDNYQQMIGLSGLAMVGKTMGELFPADLAAKMTADDWGVVARGEVLRLEETLNGRHYITIKFPIVGGGENLLAGYTIDITAQKQAEQALHKSEMRYRALIDLAVDGILLGTPAGLIYEANQTLCELFGLARADLIGKHVSELPFTPNCLERTPFRFDLLQTGQTVLSERTIRRPDGSEVVVEMRSKMMPDGTYQSIYRDITGRKRTERQLETERTRYFNFYNLSPVGYFSISNQGVIQEVNRTSANLLGVLQEALVQQPLSRFVFADDLTRYDACRQQLVETGLPQACDLRMVKADGTAFWTRLELTLMRDVAGGDSVCRIVLIDIGQRKGAEQALEAYRTRLSQLVVELSRVEECEQQRLAVCLHDEVAQNLALLRMRLGALEITLGAGSAQAEIARIRDLLELTLAQTRTLVFDLSPPVLHQLGLAAALEWAGEKLCRDHQLAFAVRDNGEPKPLDDEGKVLLFRCARELMMNTVKHAKARRLTVTLEWLNDQACVTVEDDGCGFAAAGLDQRMHKVGFGLFSVQERLTGVGGRCAIESEPGGGTRVTLALPLHHQSSRSAPGHGVDGDNKRGNP
ncbi:MAG: PAS domain S-box protein [Lentisphaeria bacterium]